MKANTSGLAQNFSIIISSQQEFIPLSLFHLAAFLELAYARSVLTAHSESDWHNEISQVICNSTNPQSICGCDFNAYKYLAPYLQFTQIHHQPLGWIQSHAQP